MLVYLNVIKNLEYSSLNLVQGEPQLLVGKLDMLLFLIQYSVGV